MLEEQKVGIVRRKYMQEEASAFWRKSPEVKMCETVGDAVQQTGGDAQMSKKSQPF